MKLEAIIVRADIIRAASSHLETTSKPNGRGLISRLKFLQNVFAVQHCNCKNIGYSTLSDFYSIDFFA